MAAVPFPRSPLYPEDLADWLELTAIQSDDRNASGGDLDAELKRLGVSNREDLLGQTFTELDLRERSAGENAYPFIRSGVSIELGKNLATSQLIFSV
jgi:hypothetical protein